MFGEEGQPGLEKRLAELLNLDFAMDEQERQAELRSLLAEHLLPMMIAGQSLDGLRSETGQQLINRSLVNGPGHRLLTADISGSQDHGV